ncbi:hypothetical protein DH2020_021923 [Rehmannia glutinosa]|uniref:xyloglucan:xyloglucosyl transferase n=1 Tax=Rehmannia glutinosa TaxID=99300 RepID=A0ABR0WBV0_REHGL
MGDGHGQVTSVFYVDNIPIRVFKNNTKIGVMYPKQAMQIEGSLWDGSDWATDGGQTKVNWSAAPFHAHFQDFNVDAGPLKTSNNINENCYASDYWWNQKKYWTLDHNQQKEYEKVRAKYMNYDYCDDRERHPTTPPECASNRI